MKLNDFITMLLNTFKRKNNPLLLNEPNNALLLSKSNNALVVNDKMTDIVKTNNTIQYRTITMNDILQLCDAYAYNLIIAYGPKIHQSFGFKVGFPTTKVGLNTTTYENYFLNIKRIESKDDPESTYNESITKLVIEIGTEANNTILYRFEYTDNQRDIVIQTVKNYTESLFNGEFKNKAKTITLSELKNTYVTECKLTVNNLPSEEVINTAHEDILGLELLYQMLNSALYTYYKDRKKNYFEMYTNTYTEDLYSNKQITIQKYVKLERGCKQQSTTTNPDTYDDIPSKDLKQQISHILKFYNDQSQQTQSLEEKEIMKTKHERFLSIQSAYTLFISNQKYANELQELQTLVNNELQKIKDIKDSNAHHGILHEYNVLKTLLLEE